MAGSLMVISRGLMRASTATLETVMCAWSISLWDLSLWFPVALRRRRERWSRILGPLVSGIKTKYRTSKGAAIQVISCRDHLHPFAETAYVLRRGPRAADNEFSQT